MIEALKKGMGIYVHIPFCLQKCTYCDFSSIALNNSTSLEDYCLCLQKEIAGHSTQHRMQNISTVYFGGGTPSLLTAGQVEDILRALRQEFSFLDDVEITLEANPATLSRTKLRDLRDAGINRLSLGVQSFSDSDLRVLGRVHSSSDALTTVEDLHFLSWKNFNIDLIYGLPGQSIDRWKENLDMVVACEPSHISAYLLQLDPCTPLARDLARGLWEPLEEESEEAMFNLAREHLQGNNYRHYEISNYCRRGRECRHNLIYWSGQEYLGLGSAAVSFQAAKRWINPWPLENYCAPLRCGRLPGIQVLETMNSEELQAEALVMGLRQIEGVDLEELKNRLGIDPHTHYGTLIDDFIERGWLKMLEGRLCLHPDMIFVSNQILCHFLDNRKS
ncbi:MAG TPA: radical SAM family heme chaperone HemW [Syntrophomonadaceae bacterium]|nr:radical SAM family heme chaperone HemW [Syntrophomonadaceae bacterium]